MYIGGVRLCVCVPLCDGYLHSSQTQSKTKANVKKMCGRVCMHREHRHTKCVRGDTMSERSIDVSTFIVTTMSVHIIFVR